MNKTFIIGEAGVNHNGDMTLAKKLIDIAVKAGVDAVKFQFFTAENTVTRNAEKAEYQKKSDKDENQFQMLKKLEINYEQHLELQKYAKDKQILFFTTTGEFEKIRLINDLNVPLLKVASGELENVPFLREVGKCGKKTLLSTGMATLGEIEFAIKELQSAGSGDISLLHCTTQYPTPMEDANLNAIPMMKLAFGLPVGLSDHTLGIETAIAAVAMGATIIEKHFTIDKSMEGPDHQASLSPEELGEMVKAIRNIEKAMGSGIKTVTASEAGNIPIVRKSIVAKTPIQKGDVFTAENVTPKRPQGGISPKNWDMVIGSRAKKDFDVDDLIEL